MYCIFNVTGPEEMKVFKKIIDNSEVRQLSSERNKVVLKLLVQRSVAFKSGSLAWSECIKLLGKQAETTQLHFINR